MRVQKRYVFQFNQEEDFIGKINCRSTLTLTFPKRLWLDLLEDNHVNRIVLVSCMASHKIQKLLYFFRSKVLEVARNFYVYFPALRILFQFILHRICPYYNRQNRIYIIHIIVSNLCIFIDIILDLFPTVFKHD